MRAILIPSLFCSFCSFASAIRSEAQKPVGLLHHLNSDNSDSAPPPVYRDELLSLHKSLVDIESITGNEKDVGTFLTEYLEARGYRTTLQPLPSSTSSSAAGNERCNVVAWPGSSHRPSARLLLTSHIDVVPPYIPYKIDADADEITADTVIHGRGSVDAKASIAAQITALEQLLQAGEIDREDVMLLYVVGEETTGDGMRFYSESQQQQKPPRSFDAVIFGEPTENKLACGHKGHMGCTLTAKGKAGHSGYPWLGKSATELLIRALMGILDKDLGSSDRFGNTTVNVGILDGGVAANVIPESAFAKLAVRVATAPQQTGQNIVRERIEEAIRAVDAEALSFSCTNGYGAVECSCDVEGFKNITVNYGTDVPNLKGNHTRYLYGPGDILVAHSDHEALSVGDLETAVEGYKLLIRHALVGR